MPPGALGFPIISTVTLERDVEALCRFPTRTVGTPGHLAARHYLLGRFAELELAPYSAATFELPYGPLEPNFANVVGVAAGTDAALPPLLIGAHYDTVPATPGADDNAAAVAIVLEVAARLKAKPAARSVIVAHFDAEEPPYFHTALMGSTRFVAEHGGADVHAAIILDLVGHAVTLPGFEKVLAVMGTESDPTLAATVAELNGAHLPIITLPNRFMADMSDHYAFRLAGRPYLFLTCGQGRHYHAPTDTPATLDYYKMALVADLLEELVRRVAESQLGGRVDHSTAETDTLNLRKALGPDVTASLGLRSPGDFERVIGQLVARFRAG